MSTEFVKNINVSCVASGGKDAEPKVEYYLRRLLNCLEIWQDALRTVAPCHNITITVERRRLNE